ncbi:hypothetical protein Zmor_013234 [Zophobas morio]|uniref:Uncharacterized protein n=1 Tax=Zophobas morio TaxID=2755281 RepID=A0AA38MEG9_9CUCU|nr:hypothetical protein Zmor_013234 [Zophobas morio]
MLRSVHTRAPRSICSEGSYANCRVPESDTSVKATPTLGVFFIFVPFFPSVGTVRFLVRKNSLTFSQLAGVAVLLGRPDVSALFADTISTHQHTNRVATDAVFIVGFFLSIVLAKKLRCRTHATRTLF